jgi:DNA polymerase III delta prime subunit
VLNQNLNQILDHFHENRLSHAFLIETNSQEQTLASLKGILKEINCEKEYQSNCHQCNLCHLIDSESLPSLVIIRPDGQVIRKEQILELKKKFATMPIYSKFNMYIIMNAEKLNASSANTLLKFLEEPENGILGFFLTNNRENIIDTIKSRCQIVSNFYEKQNDLDDIFYQQVIDLMTEIHLSKDKAILYNKDKVGSLTRDTLQKVFQKMIEIYFYYYEQKVKNLELEKYLEVAFLKKKRTDDILHQLHLVKNLEEELNFNVNLNMILDRLVIETR